MAYKHTDFVQLLHLYVEQLTKLRVQIVASQKTIHLGICHALRNRVRILCHGNGFVEYHCIGTAFPAIYSCIS